ncbi:hypothetical protein H0H81_002938 [Sphagnurus paluster]|uniref:ERCC1-like central domain-containing protein n=1 Tax=Sphagnurus paluster TaxID=117069 RepID=A0A9P7K923_9AGAR|nr:hypothetical protein H0H81_002938 [Sphagnurus paluster]
MMPNLIKRGNTLLDCIRNVGKEFGDIIADYQVGRTTGVLFLSLKYHRLHPEYIHIRIEKLGQSYTLRILLVLCDINIAMQFENSPRFDEAGHYLSTLKQFEHKPPDMIKERVDKDYNSILRTALTSISKVNKTDVETLRTSFGVRLDIDLPRLMLNLVPKSFANIAKATPEQLRNLPGFGQVKVKNIKNTFDKPLRNNATRTLPAAVAASQSQSQSTIGGTVTASKESTTPPMSATVAKPSAKGKEKQTAPPPRSPSPVWDIELDLNDDDLSSVETGPLPEYPPQPFDIDLDLN